MGLPSASYTFPVSVLHRRSRMIFFIQFGNYQLRRTADNVLAFKVKEG